MSSSAWVALAIGIATLVIAPAFRLLMRIDRRLFSIATNHIPHIYDRMMELDGRPAPTLEDLK